LAIGILFYVFVLGNPANFQGGHTGPGAHPVEEGIGKWFGTVYMGGFVVPVLISVLLICLTFVIERFLYLSKAKGKFSGSELVRKVQYHLANKNVDAALAECDKQKGSVGNVMKAGLRKYKEMITVADLDAEQKVIIEEMKMIDDSPEDMLGEIFSREFFPGHPLGASITGTAETVRSFDHERTRKLGTRTPA